MQYCCLKLCNNLVHIFYMLFLLHRLNRNQLGILMEHHQPKDNKSQQGILYIQKLLYLNNSQVRKVSHIFLSQFACIPNQLCISMQLQYLLDYSSHRLK